MLNESSAESFLHYFHVAISSHLSEKPKIYLVLYGRFNTGLTVFRAGMMFVWLKMKAIILRGCKTQNKKELKLAAAEWVLNTSFSGQTCDLRDNLFSYLSSVLAG